MKKIILGAALATTITSAFAQTISTIAGIGAFPYNGDSIQATAAAIVYPTDIVIDKSDNIIFSDNLTRVRKISPAGIISTIAGNATYSSTGDGGPATTATLSNPGHLALDKKGNLYINEYVTFRLRKIDAAGIITTFAGTGVNGYSGDGGPATAAQISNNTLGMTVDTAGNVYISDAGRIRKIDTNGIITTICGTGTSGYSGDGGPASAARIGYSSQALRANRLGEVIFSDVAAFRLRKISASGIITTICGTGVSGYAGDGGPATAAQVKLCGGITTDWDGNIYFAENGGKIRKIDTSGLVSWVAGDGTYGFAGDGGPATAAKLNRPGALCTGDYSSPSGERSVTLYIGDYQNYRIRKITYPANLSSANISAQSKLTLLPNPTHSGRFSVQITLPQREEMDI
ncbi:MAG: hypothetical protein H7257_14365, partial [Taibaiella sp.]|nr:hypothetical protein [Taibaiella sp.]